MRKRFWTYNLVILIIFSAGCSESFLDIGQRGATNESDFYHTDEEALEALMAIYDNLQNAHYSLLNVLNALADEAYAGGGQRGDNGGMIEELNEFRFGPTNTTISNTFGWLYTGIYRANRVIDRVSPDTDDKKLIIAQAKFLRAFYYFYLVTLWGDVPLVLHELEFEKYALPRTDQDVIWEQIEKDLREAVAGLPLKSALPVLYGDLASGGTARAFLGKSLLFQQKYTEAAAQLDTVICSLEYDLFPEYDRILRPESEHACESLFEIAFTTGKYYQYYPGSESNLWLYFMSPRETYFQSGDLRIYEGWGFLNPRESLYQAFLNAGDTVRRNATMISEDDLIDKGGRLRNIFGSLPYANDGYARLKYVLYMDDGGPPNPKANNGTNIRMLRFADVLLMAAEAHNRKEVPDDSRASEYLNRVRERVDLQPVFFTGDDLFEAIKQERRLELAFEFVRFQDLLRWGEAHDVLKDQGRLIPVGNGDFFSIPEAGFKTGKHELLPIPEQEMNVNPYMEQNTGY